MNFPVGTVLKKGESPYNIVEVLTELEKTEFNGYIIQSVKSSCFEEGSLIIRLGSPIGSLVECMSNDKIFKANEALNYFMNQTKGNGFYQVVELTRTQVDLITAFDEKLLFTEKIALKDVGRIIPSAFEDKFSTQENKQDVFEAHGLGGLKW